MNQIEEEFNYYYLQQSYEYSEEPHYEENCKEEEELGDNIINNEDNKSNGRKARINFATSKRLRILPKKYHIYTLDYKKRVIEDVNKIFIIILLHKNR